MEYGCVSIFQYNFTSKNKINNGPDFLSRSVSLTLGIRSQLFVEFYIRNGGGSIMQRQRSKSNAGVHKSVLS